VLIGVPLRSSGEELCHSALSSQVLSELALPKSYPFGALQVARPADRYDGDHQRIFEQKIPADNPCDEFAKHGVSIGVGAAGE
jgi:hypothetical protein